MSSVGIFFVCHNPDTVNIVAHHLQHKDVYIILVGYHDNPVRHPRVIVSCEQKNHLEDEPKLLTFTAWYLLVKNNIVNYQHYCILEYDIDI